MSFGSLHLELLGEAMAVATCDGRWKSLEARLVSGGKSNLTFEISSEAGSAILRRPPTSGVLPSAHDMVREVRVQRALAHTPVPVAKVIMAEPSGELIGAPFYVMEKVPGYVIRGELPRDYVESPAEGQALADCLIGVLFQLHDIDPELIGLADYGRPLDFMSRQVRRWKEQWKLTTTFEVKAIDELARRLEKTIPPLLRPSVVHGDYRLDNCMMSLEKPYEINAVLDWELSTLGDAISDLGLTLFFWREPHDIPLSLIPSVTSREGFPDRAYLAQRYAAKAGIDLPDMAFYEAFARFKYAIIAQGILVRGLQNAMAGQSFGDLRQEIESVAEEGLLRLIEKGGR
jgi:aminoglycoside phosphotransferase (APT) family kinase protein